MTKQNKPKFAPTVNLAWKKQHVLPSVSGATCVCNRELDFAAVGDNLRAKKIPEILRSAALMHHQ